jgi:hypothetical protein
MYAPKHLPARVYYRRIETASMRVRLRVRPTSAAPGPSAAEVMSSSGGTWIGSFESISNETQQSGDLVR